MKSSVGLHFSRALTRPIVPLCITALMTVPTSDNEREPLLGTSSQTPARPVTARENLHKKAIKRFKQEIFIGQMRLMFWVAIQSLITGIINATTVSNTKTWATFMVRVFE